MHRPRRQMLLSLVALCCNPVRILVISFILFVSCFLASPDIKAGTEYYASSALSETEEKVEDGFREKDGMHFVVKFDGGENAEAGHLISILLEEAYIAVGGDIGYYPEDAIGAVLYSMEQFRDVTRSPDWVGAVYDGRIKVPTGGITRKTIALEKVLFHEYTHAVVHRLSGGRAPVWLNEGIAQYEEGKRQVSYMDIIRAVLRSGQGISLRKLEGSFMGMDSNSAAAAYALSLSATEYIIGEFGMSGVRRILESLGDGMSLDEAISYALYLSYDDLRRVWLLSLRMN